MPNEDKEQAEIAEVLADRTEEELASLRPLAEGTGIALRILTNTLELAKKENKVYRDALEDLKTRPSSAIAAGEALEAGRVIHDGDDPIAPLDRREEPLQEDVNPAVAAWDLGVRAGLIHPLDARTFINFAQWAEHYERERG